jgi:hypothetical protein
MRIRTDPKPYTTHRVAPGGPDKWSTWRVIYEVRRRANGELLGFAKGWTDSRIWHAYGPDHQLMACQGFDCPEAVARYVAAEL